MRDLVSDMERRHRAWGKGLSDAWGNSLVDNDDTPEKDNGDDPNPHPQEIVDPNIVWAIKWTPAQFRFIKTLLKKRMATTGETKEQAAEEILKQMKKEES